MKTTTGKTKRNKSSKRAQSHEEMLRESLARPGIYDVMRLHRNYERHTRWYDAYRMAMRPVIRAVPTDHANPTVAG